jgi:1,2-dihydroxy-3-keto-5-methylthiopentene dioxygenase
MDDDTETDQRAPHRCACPAARRPAAAARRPPPPPAAHPARPRPPRRRSPNAPCSGAALRALGVLCWRMDADAYPGDAKLAAIRAVRGYTYEDVVEVSPAAVGGYAEKLKAFYEEHLHADEEIRYVLDGAGFFDVRDLEDRWVRIWCRRGDLIVLPEGIYHRFTLDAGDRVRALRLFVGEPVWTPHNRPQEAHPSRAKYAAAVAAARAVA